MIEVLEVYPVPPPEFCARLHAYDRDLCLNWDPTHKVWAIWHKDPYDGSMNHVMNVVDPNGYAAPLDGRVFQILDRNRYFAKHPEELSEKVVGKVEEDIQKAEATIHDNFKYVARDTTLKRKWAEVVDTFKKIDWNEWTKPKPLKDPNTGEYLKNVSGEVIKFKPHASIQEDKRKPVI